MTRKPIAATREYRGVVIFRNTVPGYALRWTARSKQGSPLAADTLDGIKTLIREEESAS
jgi:hypothetical protein